MGRPQDISDVQGVLLRQGDKLDLSYVGEWLARFTELVEGPDLLELFERLRAELLENVSV